MPVATTTASPRPRTTAVPLNAMLVRSASGASGSTIVVDFSTGVLSPVSGASAICSVDELVSRQSAPTASPSANITMSPITRSAVGTRSTTPSRSTLARVALRRCRAATALIAFVSCQKPIPALSTTMAAITIASSGVSWAPSLHHAIREITIATNSRTTSGSVNWCPSRRHHGAGGVVAISFGPLSASRRAASADVSPELGSVATSSTMSPIGVAQGRVGGGAARAGESAVGVAATSGTSDRRNHENRAVAVLDDLVGGAAES